jgi:hypothetical protein
MIAQSVAEIVNRRVALTVEGIDRMYLYEQGIVGFFREHRGEPLPSAALMSPMMSNLSAIRCAVSPGPARTSVKGVGIGRFADLLTTRLAQSYSLSVLREARKPAGIRRGRSAGFGLDRLTSRGVPSSRSAELQAGRAIPGEH